MVSNQAGQNPERDNTSDKPRIFEGKIRHYSLTLSRSGGRSFFDDCRIRLEVDFTTTEEPPDFVEIVFPKAEWGILGEFHKNNDGSAYIWVFLPNSEFAKYYDMLRHEENVYLRCAFEQNSDGSLGEMHHFGIDAREPIQTKEGTW